MGREDLPQYCYVSVVQAMIALGNLMRHHPSHPTLYKVWLSAVLPLVADPETTIIEKCLDEVEELVFERVVKAYKYAEATNPMKEGLRARKHETSPLTPSPKGACGSFCKPSIASLLDICSGSARSWPRASG